MARTGLFPVRAVPRSVLPMDNASYSSIKTFVRGRFRPLADRDSPALASAGGLSGFQGAPLGRETFLENTRLPEPVSAFLCQMDAKLDAILAAMHSKRLEQDFPHALDISELSAVALVFQSPLPLAPGDCLEVLLYLNQSSFSTASGIGVIKELRHGASGTSFVFAFTRLHEDEQEKIIRFVFQEERKALREKRLG